MDTDLPFIMSDWEISWFGWETIGLINSQLSYMNVIFQGHFVQYKLWVGMEPNVPPEFNLNFQLAGENVSHLFVR